MTVEITTLKNGMRVATDSIDGVESAAVGVWVDVGARDEPAELNGISHLLEHMAFKGTQRRDAQAIAQE
ncbi:MAG: insulinase family protein, partial [Alphaproteobacteria bacterium]